MNIWFPGLTNRYFQSFSLLIIFLLVFVSILLGVLKLFSGKRELAKQIWKPFKPWFIMAPIILFTVCIRQEIFVVILFLLSLFAVKEFARATGLYKDWGFIAVIYISLAILYSAIWSSWYALFAAIPAYVVAVILMIPIFRNQYKDMIQKVALSIIAFIYIGWFPSHLGFIGHHPQRFALLLFIIIGAELNDASAFTFGKFFGKKLLIPNISPKKTVEGSLGALFITTFYVLLVKRWLPGFGVIPVLFSIIIICIGGTLGDLVISYVKRDIGIKDMGVLIPGHGGLLDRIDSLIFISPLYFHMISHYVKFPGGLL